MKDSAIASGFTPEYIFTAFLIPEDGLYGAIRCTVVASTISHLREDRLKDIEIPIEVPEYVGRITELIKQAFDLKSKSKEILKKSDKILDKYF